jgi:hypothetical protein
MLMLDGCAKHGSKTSGRRWQWHTKATRRLSTRTRLPLQTSRTSARRRREHSASCRHTALARRLLARAPGALVFAGGRALRYGCSAPAEGDCAAPVMRACAARHAAAAASAALRLGGFALLTMLRR